MSIAKNMEALFITATVLFCSANFATASVHSAPVAQSTAIPSITISAKRLSAAEKAASVDQAQAEMIPSVTISAKRLSASEKTA